MAKEVVDISNVALWIPMVSTIVGASIAFITAFITARYNKKEDAKTALDSRQRERIERIYNLLVIVRNENIAEFAKMINHIHHNKEIKIDDTSEIPPLIELEMLIKLYFPSLEAYRKELQSVIQGFHKKALEFRGKDYLNENLVMKQNDASFLLKLQTNVIENIDNMQKQVINNSIV